MLVKRFAKDAYTINYVSFVKAIDEAQEYMEKHGMLDLAGVMRIFHISMETNVY